MEINVRTATIDDCMDIGSRMRRADREEVWASAKVGPLTAMIESFNVSPMVWTGEVDGEPVCMFGVGAVNILSQRGAPWLLGVEGLERYSFAFLRRNRPIIKEMIGTFSYLENYVDARNTTSIRWLRWLGFTIEKPQPHGHMMLPFHRFWMEANDNV